MTTTHNMKRLIVGFATGVLVSGGLGLAGLGLAGGTAQADPQSPGPYQCVPRPTVAGANTSAHSSSRRNIIFPAQDITVVWDNCVCHTYWRTTIARGNVPMSDGGRSTSFLGRT